MTVWYVLGLLMKEWLPVWRVAANILNKKSRTAKNGWSSSLGFGRNANNSSPKKNASCYEMFKQKASDLD
jgi:hypothetical protein